MPGLLLSMLHLPKPPSQFINLFWNFRVQLKRLPCARLPGLQHYLNARRWCIVPTVENAFDLHDNEAEFDFSCTGF